jgi:hypothetical protein
VALVTTWKVALEVEHEVRVEVHLAGRDVVKVDGQVVSNSWGQRFRRRLPIPIGGGHSAGVEIDVRRVWPVCTLSVDGKTVAPTQRPRVPLWSWSLAFLCIAAWFVPHEGHGSGGFVATRAVVAALGAWLSVFLGADERRWHGAAAGLLLAAGAWAFALFVK